MITNWAGHRLFLDFLMIGKLPTLPTIYSASTVSPAHYNQVVVATASAATNRTNLTNAVAACPVGGAIAIDGSPTGGVFDLGSSNWAANGYTDQTVSINKAVTIFPLAGYGAFESNPYGDGRRYARRFQRLLTIVGFITCSADVAWRGIKFTIDAMPAPATSTTYSEWSTVGIKSGNLGYSYSLVYTSGNGDIQGCEGHIGPTGGARATFDASASAPRPSDFKSPNRWTIDGNPRVIEINRITATVTSGSNVLTVSAITGNAPPIQVGSKINLAGVPNGTSVTALGTGTGGVGTYTLSANATATTVAGVNDGGDVALFSTATQFGQTYWGWNDPDWACYNRYHQGPGFCQLLNWTGTSFVFKNNYIHDITQGLNASMNPAAGNATQNIEVTDNEFRRIYVDQIYIQPQSSLPNIARVSAKIARNIQRDFISNTRDPNDPHSDAQQFNGQYKNERVMRPLGRFKGWANLIYTNNNDRGNCQPYYWATSNGHFADSVFTGAGAVANGGTGSPAFWCLYGGAVIDCVSINNNKGFQSSGVRDMLFANNAFFSQQSLRFIDNQVDSPNTGSILMGRGSTTVADSVIADSYNVIQNTIYDVNASSSTFREAARKTVNNVLLGPYEQANPGPRTALMASTFLNSEVPLTSPFAAFSAFQRQTAHASKGPRFTTLAEMMSAAEPHEFALEFWPKREVALNTLITSDAHHVHGTRGVLRTVVPNAGVEWQALSMWDQSVVTAWSATTGTINPGDLIQVRGLSSAANAATTDLSVTIDGNLRSFSVSTLSPPWSRVQPAQTGNSRIGRVTSGGAAENGFLGHTIANNNHRKLSFVFDFTCRNTSVSQLMFGAATGASFLISQTSASLQILLRNGATSIVSATATAQFVVGNSYRVHIAIDLDHEDPSMRLVVVVNGTRVTSFTPAPTIYTGTDIGIKMDTEDFGALAYSGGSNPFLGDFGMMAFWPDKFYDWTDPALRDQTTTTKLINGNEVDGTTMAAVFIKGDASQINGTRTANLGDGGLMDNTGTDVVQL